MVVISLDGVGKQDCFLISPRFWSMVALSISLRGLKMPKCERATLFVYSCVSVFLFFVLLPRK